MGVETEQEIERDREFDLDRTISLSDGIFAFALTLLVLSISVPELTHPSNADLWNHLLDRRSELMSYLISFAVIGAAWIRHHRFCGQLRSVDARFLVINLCFLATVAFVPYPTEVLGLYGDLTAFAFYAVTLTLLVLTFEVLSEHAGRGGLRREPESPQDRLARRLGSVMAISAFLISIPIAVAVGNWAGYLAWIILPNADQLIFRAGLLKR